MKNKILIGIIALVSLLLIASVVLSKVGLIDGGEASAKEKEVQIINNVEDLEDGCLYIWKNCEGKKITAEDNEFILCPEGNTNVKYKDKGTSQANYTVWIDSSEDKLIPTVTRADKIVYVSKKAVPDSYDFLRLYENGYSIGVTSLLPDEAGHYYVNYMQTKAKDFKQYINTECDAGDLAGLNVQKLYLEKVGKASLTEDNVTESGIVSGLKKNEQYVCEFYTGTYFQDYMLTANQHTFTEFEDFECHGYEFLHSNCISVDIPDWLCSGYYYINGEALFRFVDDEDVEAYNGKPYDGNIDWNVPLIQYDEYGKVIYDPSKPELNDEEEEVTEEENEELDEVPEAVTISEANWTYTVSGTDPFCAVIKITPLENAEPATLTFTDPEGNIEMFEEKNNEITVNLEKSIEGEYAFELDNILGRTFSVLYSTGDTYYGPEEAASASEPDGD